MQYILSEEEYRDLVEATRKMEVKKDAIIMDLCRRIANTEPVKVSWRTTPGPNEPWGCIHDRENEWYCDECPVRKVCPEKDKNLSK